MWAMILGNTARWQRNNTRNSGKVIEYVNTVLLLWENGVHFHWRISRSLYKTHFWIVLLWSKEVVIFIHQHLLLIIEGLPLVSSAWDFCLSWYVSQNSLVDRRCLWLTETQFPLLSVKTVGKWPLGYDEGQNQILMLSIAAGKNINKMIIWGFYEWSILNYC